MKKFAKIIVSLLLVVLLCLGLSACGKTKFSVADDFKDKKNSTSTIMGGFVAETDDFYYVINGVGDSTDDNAFGKATGKGSLVAVKKSDMSYAVVVPKLFVASDYNAGVYVIDGYVYYATPSTAKELSGKAKNTNLTFAKTKLDGTDFVEFATVEGLSSEYRFYKAGDNVVYLVYYDTANTKLVSYNTSTKTATDICVTSEEADSSVNNESLDAYKFFDNADLENGIVAYTTKIYKGNYDEDSTRSTEKYNKLYVYKAGSSKPYTAFKNGKDASLKDENYSINAVVGGEVVYTVTTTLDTTGKVYKGENKLVNSTLYDSTFIYISDDCVYTFDSTNGAIIKNNGSEKEIVAKTSDVSTLLYKDGDYFYFISSGSKLARIKEGAKYVAYLSEDAVSTSWFNPVLVDSTVFYCDDSVAGASNIKYLVIDNSLDAELTEEDYSFAGQKFVADSLRSEEDKTAEVDSNIDGLSNYLDDNGRITLGKEDAESTEYRYNVVKSAYDNLSKDSKESIEDCATTLCKYEDAIELSYICNKLNGIEFEMTGDTESLAKYKTDYESAKALFDKMFEDEGQEYVTSVCNLMAGNSYYYFYTAYNLFND